MFLGEGDEVYTIQLSNSAEPSTNKLPDNKDFVVNGLSDIDRLFVDELSQVFFSVFSSMSSTRATRSSSTLWASFEEGTGSAARCYHL